MLLYQLGPYSFEARVNAIKLELGHESTFYKTKIVNLDPLLNDNQEISDCSE